MKKLIFYPIVLVAFLFSACSKSGDFSIDLSGGFGGGGWGPPGGRAYDRNYFDNKGLEFIWVPGNRYFIYKDSATGITDSVIVTQNYTGSVFHDSVPGNPPVPPFTHEIYNFTLQKISGSSYQTWFEASASCDSQYRHSAHFIDSDFELSDKQTNLPVFWYPFISSGVNQYTLVPTITIEGTTYIQIHKFFATNGLQPTDINYKATICYWEKGTGIIKKEIRTYNSVKTFLLVRIG